jgi:hypothetical protein
MVLTVTRKANRSARLRYRQFPTASPLQTIRQRLRMSRREEGPGACNNVWPPGVRYRPCGEAGRSKYGPVAPGTATVDHSTMRPPDGQRAPSTFHPLFSIRPFSLAGSIGPKGGHR